MSEDMVPLEVYEIQRARADLLQRLVDEYRGLLSEYRDTVRRTMSPCASRRSREIEDRISAQLESGK